MSVTIVDYKVPIYSQCHKLSWSVLEDVVVMVGGERKE